MAAGADGEVAEPASGAGFELRDGALGASVVDSPGRGSGAGGGERLKLHVRKAFNFFSLLGMMALRSGCPGVS
jgi:hypothetical protein